MQSNKLNLLIGVLLIAVIGLMGAIGYLFLSAGKGSNGANNPTAPNQTAPAAEVREPFKDEDLYGELLSQVNKDEQLGGYFFVTGALKSTSGQEPWGAFTLNVGSGEVSPINHTDPAYFLNASADEKKYLYAGRPWKTDSQPGIYNDSILLTDFNETNALSITEDPRGDFFTRLRLPRWSPDGKSYVYSAQKWSTEREKPDVGDITSWKISVGTLDTTSSHFADGYGAVWVAEGRALAYVKRDGIYVKAYTAGADHSKVPEYKVVSEFKTITRTDSYSPRNQIGVSPDGKYIVVQHLFASPDISNSSIEIYKLELETSAPSARLVKRIALEGAEGFFWPLFSPEGRYLAFQTSNFESGANENNTVRIYDLVEQKYIKDLDFNQFRFDSAFNTDWVATISM